MAKETQDGAAEQLNRAAARAGSAGPKVKFDDAKMHSSYANVCNISFTREEVLLLFGMSEAWQSGQQEVNVQLTERVILSPFAAKRLNMLLGAILQQYEQKFGSLASAIPAGAAGTTSARGSAVLPEAAGG